MELQMINNATRIEVPSIPLIEDIIKTVSQYKYFSAFDVASGFHQIPLEAESRFLTAFNSPWGVYKFNTTPMGLSGSPGTFQRVMDNIFRDMKDQLLIYIDDIIIFSNNENEHIKTMNEFLHRIVHSGLKLRLDKSKFGVDELTYLGFRISQRGIEVDPAKSKAITELKQPNNLKQLRAFLGMTNFFRRFIPNYALMTESLRQLLKKDAEYKWTWECQQAFDSLKHALSSAPILSSPKEKGEFVLQTDASYLGIGAVLFQKQPDLKVITYLSRSINQHEQNYPPIHLEALAIVWALSQIDSYVYGMPLTIITDHQPLISLFSSKDLKGKLARYQLRHMQYQAKILYKPGGLNVVADYLSRQPVHYINMVMPDKMPWNDKQWHYNQDELQELQTLHEQKKIIKRNGRFYNLANEGGSGGIIPPKEKRKEFLEAFHQHPLFGSHFGWEKVQEKLRKLMDWQGIKEEYKELCRTCIQCKQNKSIPADVIKYKNQSIICGEVPLGKVNIDILQHGKKNEDGYIAVVIAVDTLTRFAMAAPIRKLTSEEVILALLRDIFFKYGIPKQIITDKGTCFVSEEFQDFIEKLGIVHHTCTANHHQSNGVVERLNRTINEAIRIYQGKDWIQTVNNTIFTYNDSIHPKTKLSPFYLMMGRHANCGVTENQVVTTGEYKEEIKQWEEYLKELQQHWINQFLKSKESGDKLKGIEVDIHIGDQVMKKRIVNKRGTASPWIGPYTVIGKDEHQRIHIKKGRKQEWLHVSQCKRFKTGGEDVKE
uniref:RNA-directed DNA polymerase n=1 Tax=Strongyloides papillosus TaxID=174720 RepID=A0A0N5C2Q3_STREA